MAALTSNDNWAKITSDQQQDILDAEGIGGISSLSIGDDSSLIKSLEETPLANWKTKVDALPKQFSNAALAAAILLEPETQTVKLTSGTLKTEDDVRNWIVDVEENLLNKIQDGPIVIS